MVIISSHWKPSFPLSKDEIRLQVSIIEVQAEMPTKLNSGVLGAPITGEALIKKMSVFALSPPTL
jgi:hypothetical protein